MGVVGSATRHFLAHHIDAPPEMEVRSKMAMMPKISLHCAMKLVWTSILAAFSRNILVLFSGSGVGG